MIIKRIVQCVLCLSILLAGTAQATSMTGGVHHSVNMCVFDLMGKNGALFQAFKEFKTESLKLGLEIKLKAYRDERIATEDFKAGVCDLVNVTGIRARLFNQFTGTIDSIGSLPTYEHLKIVIETLATEKAAPLMVSGDYEVVSIIPAGAIFMFVNDKRIRTPETMAGKTIGVLDNAPEMPKLVALAGMTPVATSLTNLYSKFNNRNIDITAGPAVIYGPLELHKGLEPDGGILDYPLMQVTIQVIARHKKLPRRFGVEIRNYSTVMFDRAIDIIKRSEEQIPKKYWVHIPEIDAIAWTEVFRQSRISLRDENVYNGKALRLFRKVRCKLQPASPECTAKNKE
ncbi:MAG: hypothetical protein KUG82_20530 [Pseudomonadales bacterium]|nr:hypothetical protein [Pseudomonadales bacterium]